MFIPPGFPTWSFSIPEVPECPEDLFVEPSPKKEKIEGSFCKNCKEYVLMAEPNQEDKITFICYLCRTDKYR